MALTDPLGDMLTRIRNGQSARKDSVTTPASKLRARVLDVLQREGYIRGYSEEALGKHPGLRAHPGLRFRIFPDRLPTPASPQGSARTQAAELRLLLLSLGVSDQQIEIAERVLAGQGKGAWPTCGTGLSGHTPRDASKAPTSLKKKLKNATSLKATPKAKDSDDVRNQVDGVVKAREKKGQMDPTVANMWEAAKASGMVAEALQRHGIQGAVVAPPAATDAGPLRADQVAAGASDDSGVAPTPKPPATSTSVAPPVDVTSAKSLAAGLMAMPPRASKRRPSLLVKAPWSVPSSMFGAPPAAIGIDTKALQLNGSAPAPTIVSGSHSGCASRGLPDEKGVLPLHA